MVEHISENMSEVEGDKKKGLKIMANTSREAAKLYGLYLKHSGSLTKLGGIPCCVRVLQFSVVNDHLGQCFKLWDTGAKIYAECFISPKTVSYLNTTVLYRI